MTDGDTPFHEWGSRSRSDLSEDKIDKLGTVLAAILREAATLIHEQVLGDDERACRLAATLVFRFERFPGDDKPFTGIASLPDDRVIAAYLIKHAAMAIDEVMNGPE